MLFLFWLGFLFGVSAVVALEGLILYLAIDRLRRRTAAPLPSDAERRDLDCEQSLAFARGKKGIVWVLDPEKVPRLATDSPTKGPKEPKTKKGIVEVCPIKKYAKIKDRSLILSDTDGSREIIELLDCTVVAVSASELSTRKWAKRYPIRLESKNSVFYNGNKICYLFLETSWEKESWCKALRLAACSDKEKLNWFAQLSEEFHQYLLSFNVEYPSFLKPSALFSEVIEKTNKVDVSSSRVRVFLKKLAKKTTKYGLESKPSSVSSSTRGERKLGDKIRSLHVVSLTEGSIKSSLEGKSSGSSLQEVVQPSSPTSNTSLPPIIPDVACDEKNVNDEGTLCWNLLFSRLFFDAKRSDVLINGIKARIQRTLSNMRIPSYIGSITCTGLDLGNLPPFIHKITVLPVDLNEMWAVEVDIEYSGGIVLDFETRIEVCEPELQRDIMDTGLGPSAEGELTSDLLEGIEHYGNQLGFSSNSVGRMDNIDEEDKVDGLKQSKSTRWTSGYVSRWKAAVHAIASHVSQVPLSLSVRIGSLRGTLRLHIKPPPSDQLWFGFTSMPDIGWNLDSSVGDRKITSSHIALLIGNRFKAAIRDSLVLPNCENISIPWMLAEKDDWVPRKVAPFIWVKQEAMDMTGLDSTGSQPEDCKMELDGGSGSNAGTLSRPDDKVETIKDIVHVQQPHPQEPLSESTASQIGLPRSISTNQSVHGRESDELKEPLLRTEEIPEKLRQIKMESPKTSSSSEELLMLDNTVSLEDVKPKKMGSRRARMMDLGKKMGEKLEEKRRHIEEKSRNIVEKMRDNARQ